MSDNQQFCLRWNNHQSTLVQVIDNLLSSGVLVDCTLAAEGQYLHAHKVVLCACSPYLETLLSQHYEKHPIVILKDVKFQELKSMMDYMYKGEVNISQDQLGQFLKAAESLQIKGLTDGGGGEGDTRDVGSTSQKRHEPTPVRKSIPHNQSRSPVVLPPHTSGLTIEPSKRTLPTHLSESQPDSPIRSREGSTSPTPRKRRRQRRLSQGEEDGHADNSCDLPMQSQSMSITSVPSSIPALSSGSSSTITKAPPPDEDSENPESDRLSGLPEGLLKEKIEPQSEMLLEPKTEYMDETNNDDSVEDLTLDDDDDYDGMIESGAGPSHGSNNPNENYAAWQQMASDRQDDAYLNPADGGHRDSQDAVTREDLSRSETSDKSAGVENEEEEQEQPMDEEEEDDAVTAEEGETESLADQSTLDDTALKKELHQHALGGGGGACSDSGDSENPKNSKKRFTPFQVETLKRVFEETPYITQSQAATIARQTGLKKLQVRKWFSDYRCKIKRLSAGLEIQTIAAPTQETSVTSAAEEKRSSKERVPKKRILARFETDQQNDVEGVAPVNSSDKDCSAVLDDLDVASPSARSFKPQHKRGRKKTKKRGDAESYGSSIKRNKKSVAVDYAESKQVKRFTPYQVETLKRTYAAHPYITQREAAVVARTIGLKKMQVRKWFCDYRCKMKKQSQRQQNDLCGDVSESNDSKIVEHIPKKRLLVRFANDQLSSEPEHEQEEEEEDDDEEEEDEEDAAEEEESVSADEMHANGVIEEKRGVRSRIQKRTFRFTERQLKLLNEEFDRSQFLTEEKLNMLCNKLKERRERIQTWFKMRRYKLRQSEQKFWQNIIG